MEKDWLRVGVITSTHGIAGEVKVYPTTDNVDRFKKLKKCILVTAGRTPEEIELDVTGVKFFKNMVILRFKQFDNINQIEKYRNAELYVTRENAVELKAGEYFICDIIGLKAVDEEGAVVGTVTDVRQTAANDVYEITDNAGKTHLFPAIRQCILDVDLAAGIVRVHVMKGLMDL